MSYQTSFKHPWFDIYTASLFIATKGKYFKAWYKEYSQIPEKKKLNYLLTLKK